MSNCFRVLTQIGAVLAVSAMVACAADEPAVKFDREIAPLLVRRCLDCHSGTEKKIGRAHV